MCESNYERCTAPLTQLIREQLHTMMAATLALDRTLSENKDALSYLAVINQGLHRQLHLCRQAELDERLHDPDEIRLDQKIVDLVPLCRDLMERVSNQTTLLDIQTSFSTSLVTLITVADPEALEDMLLTLISNSIKAIGRGGNIHLELARQERKAVFTLTDDGGGMDADTLSRLLLSPEEQEDEEEGYGLSHGVFLAQQIAALHGGIMIVDNQASKGVRLAVSIPIQEQLGNQLHSPGIPQDRSGGWDKVLVSLSDSLPIDAYRFKEADR